MHGFINPWRKSPWYPLSLRMGGPQNWSVYFREDKYFLPQLGIDQRFLSHSEHRLVAMVIVLVTSPWRTGILYTLLVLDLLYILTYSMVQSPWEANRLAASQEIPRISWNPKADYHPHKRLPPVPILDQLNPVHIPTSHLLEIRPNIIHPSTPRSPQWSLSFQFPHQGPIQPSLFTLYRYQK